MKPFLITLLLVVTTTLSASINPIDLIIRADATSRTLTMRTSTEVATETKVQIIDANGLILHTTLLHPGDYLNSRFQLNAIPAGEYEVVVTDKLGQTNQPISVTDKGITADTELAVRTFYPKIDLRADKMLTINYLNTSGKDVSVMMSDRVGHEIINDRVSSDKLSFQRAYNLKKLPAGEYHVTVSSPNVKSYTTSLVLN